jgi:hypothetical protein
MTKPKAPWRCQRCTILDGPIPRAHPQSKLCAACVAELRRRNERWCSACRAGKPAAEFSDSRGERRSYVCRACQSERNRARRAAHREELIAYSRAYNAAHREEMVVRSRAYYAAHRDEILAQKRAYYRANRDRIRAANRAYRSRRPPASLLRERTRQTERRPAYKQAERYARARRLLRLLRGEGASHAPPAN